MQKHEHRNVDLLGCPAALRYVSYEPALGPVDFKEHWFSKTNQGGIQDDGSYKIPSRRIGLDWIIAGGESGPHARPSHPDWFRSVRDQCQAAGVAFFFKQWGEFIESSLWDTKMIGVPNDKNLRIDDSKLDVAIMSRVGKKAAGRLLDGREHSEWPAP